MSQPECAPPIAYEIEADLSAITFRPCGVKSHHPLDVAYRYCARCGRFADDVNRLEEFRARMADPP